MIPIRKNQIFYKEVEENIMGMMRDRNFILIENNLQVPNVLRIDDTQMKFWAKILITREPRRLTKCSNWRGKGEYQLHILKAPVISSTPGNQNVFLPMNSSWSLDESQFKNTLQVEGKIALVLLEFRQPLEPDERPTEDDTLLELADVVYLPTSEDFKRKLSFIRGPLSRTQVQEKLLFIDCEAAAISREKSRKTPLSVVIMNYYGKILMNVKLTPRDRVRDFGQRFHGITEKKARNQQDEYIVIHEVQKMVKGKILVGHDLAMELKSLFIPKYQLFGIRDLVNAKVLQNKGIQKKNDGQWYSLKSLAKEICGLSIQEETHNALEDVKAIREIYLKIEDEWIDDVPLIKQKVVFNKVSLQDYRNRNRDEGLEAKKRRISSVHETEMEPWDVSPECHLEDVDIMLQEVIVETEMEAENMVINDEIVHNEVNDNIKETTTQTAATSTEDILREQVMKEVQTDEAELPIVNKNINLVDLKNVATETRGWDVDVDELMTETISVRGEEYVRKKVIIEYENAEGKIKTKIINF